MPVQKPVSRSISRSNLVRCRSRGRLQHLALGFSSPGARPAPPRWSTMADASFSCVVTKCRAGIDIDRVVLPSISPVSGSISDPLDLVAEELDAKRQFLVGGIDLQHIAAHAELAAGEVHIVALIVDLGQLAQDLVAPCTSPLRSLTISDRSLPASPGRRCRRRWPRSARRAARTASAWRRGAASRSPR